jgi:putative ABC transport system permease protein
VNSAVYSVADALLYRPLALPEPDRMVVTLTRKPDAGIDYDHLSAADYRHIAEHARSFEEIAATRFWNPSITGAGNPEQVRGFRATTNLFHTFRQEPLLGRAFRSEEGEPGKDDVVVLSQSFWERRFGADAGVLGREIRLDGRPYRVVGVMPRDFRYPAQAEIWSPLALDRAAWDDRRFGVLTGVARLRPGITPTEASAEVRALTGNLARDYPETNKDRIGFAAPLNEWISGELTAQFSRLLLFAVSFVLLIACANVANLQLVRMSARAREIAVRAALGANRWRLARQLAAEGVLFGAFGALGGLMFAYWGIDLIHGAMTEEVKIHLPGWDRMGINLHVFVYGLGLAMIAGICASVLPAFAGTRLDLHSALKEQSRGGLGARQRLKSTLVAFQVGLAIVLLAGAGLIAKGFRVIVEPLPNLQPEHILTARLPMPESRFDENRIRQFSGQVARAIRDLPNVVSAGVVSAVPYGGSRMSGPARIEGRPAERLSDLPIAQFQSANAEYFQTMRIPLSAGRIFSDADGPDNTRVALISKGFAELHFPGQDPLGKRVRFGVGDEGEWMTIVGVVGDVVHDYVDRRPRPVIYQPYAQAPTRSLDVVLRTAGDPYELAAPLRAAIAKIDADQPVSNLYSLRKVISNYTLGIAFVAWMMGVLGVIALLMTAVGLYGVLAYLVSERTREIGIRMALGATRSSVLGMVLRRGLSVTAAGFAIGLIAAVAVARVLASLLFGVSAGDLGAFAAVTLLLAGAAALACYIPARRAASVDPVVALRYE